MRIRTTFILTIILVGLGSYLYFLKPWKPEEVIPQGPKIWSIEEEQIVSIRIQLLKEAKNVSFAKDANGTWYLDGKERIKVDLKRWSGVPLLLEGPSSKRLIASKVDDLAPYGLDKPRMEIRLGLHDGKFLSVLVGRRTPDEKSFYIKLSEVDALYAIDHSWGEVMEGLVLLPPLEPENRKE